MPEQRVMVVEDEHIVALDIRKQIESFGYAVAGVHASGEAAIGALEAERPDLAVMDIRLQGNLDGLETARIFRTDYGVPVVMLTAFADDETLDRARDSQPFAYIIKPFEPRELRTAIVVTLYRHEMEQRLLNRERLFSTTLESIMDAVVVTDERGQIEFLNTVACSMLGLDPVMSVGSTLDAHVRFRARVDTAGYSSGPDPYRAAEEFDAELPDGSTVPVERTVSPLNDSRGALEGRVVVLRDISRRIARDRELQEQQERLRRSQKMEAIGRLTGGIAHDFNNLLTVIMGYSRLISEEIAESDHPLAGAVVEELDGIKKAAMQSAALTRQLLSFSRGQNAERSPVDLNDLITRMEPILRQLLRDDVSLAVRLTGGSATVFADASQLEQIIMNLVVNARDAMPDGGAMLVATDGRRVGPADVIGREGVEPGEFVMLSVTDTGVGMNRETAERVFDPFFTTKDPGKGTGLGLSTVYGAVVQSKGFIDMNTSPGKGTTFSVCLPAYLEAAVPAESGEERAPKGGAGETILLVEDDDAIRDLMARLLRQAGYVVLCAANPGEALIESENHGGEIHVLLSDMVMPLMSGTKLALRLQAGHSSLRVILMSGYPDAAPSEEEREATGFVFLQKPVDPATLTRTVRTILDG